MFSKGVPILNWAGFCSLTIALRKYYLIKLGKKFRFWAGHGVSGAEIKRGVAWHSFPCYSR